MKTSVGWFVFMTSIVMLTGCHRQQDNGWQLVWNDEFNRPQLDHSKWNVLIREDSKHNELQYYTPDEVTVENGCLRLRSRERDFGSKHYTSGRVDTDDKLEVTYGRFEIRAKLPAGKGFWPAHWLYPAQRDWAMERLMAEAVEKGQERLIPELRPWYTEIDIMEFLGHEPNVIWATYHYYTFQGEKQTSYAKYTSTLDFSADFHVYCLEWEPAAMRWYIDGQLFHIATVGIPHTPHFLILNTAIGGGWPGNPDSTTVFPQYHDIDYVRVFQKKRYF